MFSWTLGRLFGIPLRIHWTFWLLPFWVILSQGTLFSWSIAAFHVGLVLAMFVCVVLHELGHALAARALGVRTRDIALYPIGGVASLERIPEKPSEEFAIAVAGPAVNVAIAAMLFLGLQLGSLFVPGLLTENIAGAFLWMLMLLNVGMVLFNLVPAFPLDGGRMFRAFLAWPLGHLRATRVAAWVGTVLAIAGGLFGVFYLQNPFLLLIAFFVFSAAQQELLAVEYRARARRMFPFMDMPLTEVAQPEVSPTPFPQDGPSATRGTTVWTWDEENQHWRRQGA